MSGAGVGDCRPDYRRLWDLDRDMPAYGDGRQQIA